MIVRGALNAARELTETLINLMHPQVRESVGHKPRAHSKQAREALDSRSPLEAVPCNNWELRALMGATEGLFRASLVCSPANVL